jgi:hypothetical protein
MCGLGDWVEMGYYGIWVRLMATGLKICGGEVEWGQRDVQSDMRMIACWRFGLISRDAMCVARQFGEMKDLILDSRVDIGCSRRYDG